MRWVGAWTLTGGRLEIGRIWLAWRGWRRPTSYRVGSTRVISVGPVAVFIQPRPSSRRLDLGNLHAGTYCGASIWRSRDCRTYGLFRRVPTGFSIGSVLFWREVIARTPDEWRR